MDIVLISDFTFGLTSYSLLFSLAHLCKSLWQQPSRATSLCMKPLERRINRVVDAPDIWMDNNDIAFKDALLQVKVKYNITQEKWDSSRSI